MRGENFGNQRFEFFHHGVGDFAAFFLGQRFLQRAALVHGSGRDDAAFVGDFFEAGKFARGKLHKIPPGADRMSALEVPIIVNQWEGKSGVRLPTLGCRIPDSGSDGYLL